MNGQENKAETEYYHPVKDWLEKRLKQRFAVCHLEITAHRTFSNILKRQISRNRDIIFYFLKDAPPDITGFVRGDGPPEFVVAEVKKGAIKLDDIYQTRKYAELFDAQYALLISTTEIPEEIIRLSRVVFSLMQLPHWSRKFAIVSLEPETWKEVWFPEDPFMQKG